MPCLVSFDLSAKIDLTSVGFMFYKDGLFYVFSHSFMPEDTLEQKMRTDRVNYRKWVEDGWITMTPDAVVDYRFVKQYILDTVKENNLEVLEVCADMWNATQFAQELEDEGFTVIEIIQGMKTLAPATKDFQEKVYANKIRHNNNPVLNFAVSNAVLKKDFNQNFMLSKQNSTERIDPIAALMNCNVRALLLEGGGRDLNSHILSQDWSF